MVGYFMLRQRIAWIRDATAKISSSCLAGPVTQRETAWAIYLTLPCPIAGRRERPIPPIAVGPPAFVDVTTIPLEMNRDIETAREPIQSTWCPTLLLQCTNSQNFQLSLTPKSRINRDD